MCDSGGTVKTLNTLQGIVWRTKYGRFTTKNISKYEHFTRKINKTYSHLVCPLCFHAISAVLKLAFSSHSDFDCCPRGLRPENPPDRHFFNYSLRSKIIAPWDMSQYQNSPCSSLNTSVFYLHFRVRFSSL